MSVSSPAAWPTTSDPHLSLEALDDPAAMAWVESQNARTLGAWCASPRYDALRARLEKVYLPHERPVIPDRWQQWAYDLWQDADNPRGIWRRMPWADWRAGSKAWQTLIDFDALGAQEGKPWVCADLEILYPDGDRALVALSPGGSDAQVIREFDLTTRTFVADGFTIAKAGKHTASWIDRETVYVGWDNGKKTLTRSGYPREARRWTRGTALADAPVVFRGDASDIAVEASFDPVERRHVLVQSVDFFDSATWRLDDPATPDAWQRYDLPEHVAVGGWQGWLLLEPRLDWTPGATTYAGGALLAIRESAFLAGSRDVTPLFVPTPRTSACDWTHTRHQLIVSYLDDVQSRTMLWMPEPHGESWTWRSRAFPVAAHSHVDVSAVESTLDDEAFVDIEGYLSPPEYRLADLASDDLTRSELLDRWPTQFDATPYAVTQDVATSADGTRVPFTVIGPKERDGRARPCLLTGYGGFAVPLTPAYLTGVATGWLERGGVYVVAHIRGGGEFGNAWHQAAQGAQRQRAFDDFLAIAHALIEKGITSASQLGIRGGSNGGLLVGVAMTQRPDLFGAVVCEVPLLDMQRYHLLHAGASWIDEYGDPDEADDAPALIAYSPYHRVVSGTRYPAVLFTTSTADDRVHPAHARKMVAKMQALGIDSVWYREDTEGGHGGADELELAAHDAMVYEFLWTTLSGERA